MNLNLFHWSLIFIGFLAIVLSIIIVLRKKKHFLYYHKVLSTIGFILINLSILTIYLNNTRINLSYPHGVFGFLFFILSIINITIGIYYTGKVKPVVKKNLRNIHTWIGRVIFILVILNIIVGYIFFKPFK